MQGTTRGGRIFFHGPLVMLVMMKLPAVRARTGGWIRAPALALALLVALAVAAAPARAQLRLPGVALPPLPEIGNTVDRLPVRRGVDEARRAAPRLSARLDAVRELLRSNPDTLEADPAGDPVVRGELLWVAPVDRALDAALAQGFRILRDERIPGLDTRSVALAPPRGLDTAAALARLRALDPEAAVDFNHLYSPGAAAELSAAGASAAAPAAPIASAAPTPGARRVGLIDGGIDGAHPALRRAALRTWGCDGATVPSPHGTAVASLLVGEDGAFRGVVPGATLYAADVYCGRATGGSAESVARALGWLATERVPVVNISLVGPPNRLLERAVAVLAARGQLVVAAVGNDGPAAAPLYPAAYPLAVGVTGLGTTRRVLPEAAQGPHVAYAAPGAELAVARSATSGYAVARGTSFASPLVAGLLARALPIPDPAAAERALGALAASAADLGAPGRDPVYGWGAVAEDARIDPQVVHAQAAVLP